MVYLKKICAIITWPYRKVKEEIAFRKKIKELRKENPSHEEDYRNLNRVLTN